MGCDIHIQIEVKLADDDRWIWPLAGLRLEDISLAKVFSISPSTVRSIHREHCRRNPRPASPKRGSGK